MLDSVVSKTDVQEALSSALKRIMMNTIKGQSYNFGKTWLAGDFISVGGQAVLGEVNNSDHVHHVVLTVHHFGPSTFRVFDETLVDGVCTIYQINFSNQELDLIRWCVYEIQGDPDCEADPHDLILGLQNLNPEIKELRYK